MQQKLMKKLKGDEIMHHYKAQLPDPSLVLNQLSFIQTAPIAQQQTMEDGFLLHLQDIGDEMTEQLATTQEKIAYQGDEANPNAANAEEHQRLIKKLKDDEHIQYMNELHDTDEDLYTKMRTEREMKA